MWGWLRKPFFLCFPLVWSLNNQNNYLYANLFNVCVGSDELKGVQFFNLVA